MPSTLISITGWASQAGANGAGGADGDHIHSLHASRAGIAGELAIGSINPFGGGIGGYNLIDTITGNNGFYQRANSTGPGAGGSGSYNNASKGIDGNDGEVRIVVTWYE